MIIKKARIFYSWCKDDGVRSLEGKEVHIYRDGVEFTDEDKKEVFIPHSHIARVEYEKN